MSCCSDATPCKVERLGRSDDGNGGNEHVYGKPWCDATYSEASSCNKPSSATWKSLGFNVVPDETHVEPSETLKDQGTCDDISSTTGTDAAWYYTTNQEEDEGIGRKVHDRSCTGMTCVGVNNYFLEICEDPDWPKDKRKEQIDMAMPTVGDDGTFQAPVISQPRWQQHEVLSKQKRASNTDGDDFTD
eukprot:gnl/MRDRNA2_/MRDRNA2_40100_c0_seq1.p1 gnl/MRDRNA2_/MRDRNA2_40100_c0~~gnl/MRDRNA2_/MRDRNA2_40100_c0_seq1.p1  ORF type:complete len:188 (+),score=36.00 gnl/MRDRNA2_/MRDRNA2_40100_c0_seq1:95-658(+)